jgi:alpha-tubulin suppressor-like RCC1 family protein
LPFTFLLFTFLIAIFCTLPAFADGSIVGWGWNDFGECNIPSPNSGFIAIAAGWFHSLGLKQDGSIVAWGYNKYGQCNIPSPNSGFIAIAAGEYHSLALKKVCQYKLTGDLNDDCRLGWEDVRIFTGQWLDSDGSANLDGFNGINLLDFALLAENWLIDCEIEPNNPACIPK